MSHISKILICGARRACINNPSFGNAEKFIFVTVPNTLTDPSVGGEETNATIIELIDRALRTATESLQMEGSEMIGKTTFAIFQGNVNPLILQALNNISSLVTIDNIKAVDVRAEVETFTGLGNLVFNKIYTKALLKLSTWQDVNTYINSVLSTTDLTNKLNSAYYTSYTLAELEAMTKDERNTLRVNIENATNVDLDVTTANTTAEILEALKQYLGL